MTFFNSWQLWEKMTFVLAMAIVGVIFIGIGVRFYQKWKLRKYTALEAVKDQHRQALEHRPSVKARRAQEIPFGIRAIQSGIEVDGVWISGSNTPAQSNPGSRAPSVMLDTDSNKSAQSPERPFVQPPSSRLEAPRPAHRQPIQGRTSTATQDAAPRVRSYQMNPSPNRLSTDLPPPGRPTYQPRRSSGLRYSHVDENSDALDALEGRRTGTVAETGSQGYLMEQRAHRHPRSVSASNNGDERHAQRRPPMVRDRSDILFDPTYLPQNQQRFEALGERRRSQAAEEGHLLPRVRVSNTPSGFAPTGPGEQGFEFEELAARGHTVDPFATPLGTPMWSPKVAGEEPPSFASFVNSTPPIDNRIEPLDDSDTSQTSSEGAPALQTTDGNRLPHQSHILRKANAGFEVLRPSAPNGSHPSYRGDWNRDLERGNQPNTELLDNKYGQKKLQKTRGRADSKGSRFREEV